MTIDELKNRLSTENHIIGSTQIELGKNAILPMFLEYMKKIAFGTFTTLTTEELS